MQLSDAEWKVMRVVWERGRASVRDVFEALAEETGWAYSTVKTLLSRLAEKGVLEAGTRANARVFAPRLSAREARRSALRRLVEHAFDGALGSLVHHLFAEEKLSRRDREALRALLEAKPQRDPTSRKGG